MYFHEIEAQIEISLQETIDYVNKLASNIDIVIEEEVIPTK